MYYLLAKKEFFSFLFSSFEFYILDVNGTFSFVHVVIFFEHHTNVGNLGNSKRLSLALCFLLLLLLLLRHRAVRGRGWEELRLLFLLMLLLRG